MKILVADKFPDTQLDRLRSLGHECELNADLTAEQLPGAIAGYEVLVVRSTRVNRDTVEAADRLRLVIRAGSGTNTIDKEAAAGNDVCVCNVPGKNAVAVAELAMGLLIAVDRRIADNVIELRDGRWNKKTYSEARGLMGRRLGIVGVGDIGLAMAERAHAFGMKIVVLTRPGRDARVQARLDELEAEQVEDLHELAAGVDAISFHVPAAEETKNLVGRELLERMQPGAILINTSRGDIVDEQALIAAMDEKGIRAGLDVYRDEPGSSTGSFDSALARHPSVTGTHHIGASTDQAQDAVADEVVRIVQAFDGGDVLHCVNMDGERAARLAGSARG